jgi:Signal peptide peptidase
VRTIRITVQNKKYCGRCFICKGGYFPPIVVAYAIGLAMANTAVYVMNMGQPALLYLVPCCLGTLVYIGWRRNELIDLWEGPKALKAADDIVYGYSDNTVGTASTLSPSATHVPLSTEEGTDAFSVPSAAQDNETERDGLWTENR